MASSLSRVILIVRVAKLRHHEAEATLERVNRLAPGVIGMVVNGTDQSTTKYGYGYGSGYGNKSRHDVRPP